MRRYRQVRLEILRKREYADLKLSNSVRQFGTLGRPSAEDDLPFVVGLQFLLDAGVLMLALIFWKGGPTLSDALQARSRSVRRAIEEAQRLAEEAAIRLAEVQKRWPQLDSEVAAIRAVAESEEVLYFVGVPDGI